MKAINCSECRKKILKEARDEYLKYEYAFFRDSSRSFAVFAVCGVLSAMARRGRTKTYIKQLYNDMCLLFSTPNMFGKTITMTEVMKSLSDEYGIDWDKLEVNIEDEKHWVTGARKGVR
jgi:hypothetical protein